MDALEYSRKIRDQVRAIVEDYEFDCEDSHSTPADYGAASAGRVILMTIFAMEQALERGDYD
jgi:hypothetical protein